MNRPIDVVPSAADGRFSGLLRYPLICLSILAVGGCSAPSDPDGQQANTTPQAQALLPTSVRSLPQCAGIRAGVTLLTTEAAGRLGGRQMLSPAAEEKDSGTTQAVSKSLAGGPLAAVISHGSQPSAGYRFKWVSATQHKGEITLNVDWQQPPAGSIQATVVTNPCLVVELPTGRYRSVQASDQNGAIGRQQVN